MTIVLRKDTQREHAEAVAIGPGLTLGQSADGLPEVAIDAAAFVASRTVAANTLLDPADGLLRVKTAAGAVTVQLPSAELSWDAVHQRGRRFTVKHLSGANACTLEPDVGTEPIDGAATRVLAAGDVVTLQAFKDGAAYGWDVL